MGPYNYAFYTAMREAHKDGVEIHTYAGQPMCNARPIATIALEQHGCL